MQFQIMQMANRLSHLKLLPSNSYVHIKSRHLKNSEFECPSHSCFLAIAQHVVKLDGFEAVIVFCIKLGNGTMTKAEH